MTVVLDVAGGYGGGSRVVTTAEPVGEMLLSYAELVIWLDLPLRACLSRLLKCSFRRSLAARSCSPEAGRCSGICSLGARFSSGAGRIDFPKVPRQALDRHRVCGRGTQQSGRKKSFWGTVVSGVQERTCGRQTRSGKPCKIRINGSDVACSTHATEQDRMVAEAHQRGYREGFDAGRDSGASSSRLKIEWLERRIQGLEQKLDEATRIYEVDGHQVVDVGGYAYRWRGDSPLEVGDRVLLPENYVSRMQSGPGSTVGAVTQLGTTYRGTLSFITGRAPKADA